MTLNEFTKALLWEPSFCSCRTSKRRNGFLSWSWCDWIGGVIWGTLHLYCCDGLGIGFQQHDGTFTELSSAFTADGNTLYHELDAKTSTCTVNVRRASSSAVPPHINLYLPVSHPPPPQHHRTHPTSPAASRQTNLLTVVRSTRPPHLPILRPSPADKPPTRHRADEHHTVDPA